MSQDLPPELDHVGEGLSDNVDPIGNAMAGVPPPPPPPTGPGTHLLRDFDTNAAMVNDILAVSASELPEEAQTASTVDATGDGKSGEDQPLSTKSGAQVPISPDFFPAPRAKKRTRRSK